MAILGELGMTALGQGLQSINSQRQQDYNKETMALQFGYNCMMQQQGQNNNKEMWDYTNYENQRKHMEAAGLNPALMYGQGGGGGASTSGAQGNATSAVGGNEVQSGAASTGMALQMAQLQSQIEVTQAQANKLNADAEKTKGVDTKLSEAEIQYKHSLQALTENQAAGASWDYSKNQALIENLVANTKLLNAQTNESNVSADVKKKEIINRTLETMQGINESKERILLMRSQGKLNEAQTKQIGETIMQEWTKIAQGESYVQQGWRGMELKANEITNNLNLGERKLDIEQERLVKEWIYDGIETIKDIIPSPLPTKIKGFGK